MRFWDSSAIGPLVIEEATSVRCRQLLRADSHQIVWVLTRTEVISALCRLVRAGALDGVAAAVAESRLERLASRWTEVEATLAARDTGERLLRVHALRAADAMQLAAALAACDGQPRRRGFVTLDDALAEAAVREGFAVVIPR